MHTTKALLKSFIVNLFLSISKIIVGIVGYSSALIADGIHSFSDLATDSVAIFGNRYAMKPADKEHPFGHGKVEYLTCFVIGIVILALGLEIISNAFEQEIVIPSKLVIVVSILTIFLKLLLSRYLLRIGKRENNQILISSGKESSMDVVSSIFVLLSSILMQFSSEYFILKYSNLVATIIVGILVTKTGFDVIKENMSSMIGEQVSDMDIEEMLELLKDDQVISIDHFAVIKNGPYFQITGEVGMDQNLPLKEVHNIVEQIEQKLKDYDHRARYINIHVNPVDIDEE